MVWFSSETEMTIHQTMLWRRFGAVRKPVIEETSGETQFETDFGETVGAFSEPATPGWALLQPGTLSGPRHELAHCCLPSDAT